MLGKDNPQRTFFLSENNSNKPATQGFHKKFSTGSFFLSILLPLKKLFHHTHQAAACCCLTPTATPTTRPCPSRIRNIQLSCSRGHLHMHKIHDKPAQHKSQHLPSIVEFPPRVNACWRASISKERMLTPHFTSWKHQMHSFACAVASCKARPLPWITPQTRATTQLQEGGDQTWAGSKALTWY